MDTNNKPNELTFKSDEALEEKPTIKSDQKSVKKEQQKKKNKTLRGFLKVLIWLIVIAGVILLTLFLASKIGDGFDSIGDVVKYIRNEVGF